MKRVMIDNELLKLYKNQIIGEGHQNVVYLSEKGVAIKLAKSSNSNIEIQRKLMNIDGLTQIVLPKKFVYDRKGELEIGTVSPYIKGNEGGKAILKYTKELLLENYHNLVEESKRLSKEGICLQDINLRNTIITNDKMYFIDYDLYSIDKNPELVNKILVDRFIYNMLLGEYRLMNGKPSTMAKFYTLPTGSTENFIRNMLGNETVEKSFTKLLSIE